MRRAAVALSVLAVVPLAAGCVSRRAAAAPVVAKTKPAEPAPRSPSETKAGLERAKERKEFFPMLSDAEAHKALPMWPKQLHVPNLARVGALMPKSMQATMSALMSERKEGTLDPKLLSDVFWVVSSANDCFY